MFRHSLSSEFLDPATLRSATCSDSDKCFCGIFLVHVLRCIARMGEEYESPLVLMAPPFLFSQGPRPRSTIIDSRQLFIVNESIQVTLRCYERRQVLFITNRFDW